MREPLEELGVGRWSFDRSRGTVGCTPACRRLLGLPADGEISPSDVIAQLDDGDQSKAIEAVRRGDWQRGGELTVRARATDGSRRHVLVRWQAADASEPSWDSIEGIALEIPGGLGAGVSGSAEPPRWLRETLDLMPDSCLLIEAGNGSVVFANKTAHDLGGTDYRIAAAGDESSESYYSDLSGRRLRPDESPVARAAAGERMRGIDLLWHTELERIPLTVWSDTLPPVAGLPEMRLVVLQDVQRLKKVDETVQFLSEVSASLAELADPQLTLENIASVAVPVFADWCAVNVFEEDGSSGQVTITHSDPAKVHMARLTLERYPPRLEDAHGIARVVTSGQSELIEDINERILEEIAHNRSHLRLLRRAGLRSVVCVPLRFRDARKGTLVFATAESGRRYDRESLAVAEDIARRAVVAIDNANLYKKLQDADRRKDEFLATLAHELRNPLAPIRFGIEILKSAVKDDEVAEQTRAMMERQIRHLVRLIDDLLDVSRITRGKFELRRSRVTLQEVIAGAVESTRSLITESGQSLAIHLPDKEVFLHGDLTRLSQIFSNLLNNAAKYSDRGGKITLRADRRDADIVVDVTDTGLGIDETSAERIFDMFAQADGSLARAQSGLGIGLTLVRALTEMHGGSVSVLSPGLGRGSTFTVRLPIAAEAELARSPLPAPSGSPFSVGRLRVLVADDNRDVVVGTCRLLEEHGCEAVAAEDGDQAVAKARDGLPDLALLDLGMPGRDGLSAGRAIRQLPGGHSCTLVAVTGWGQEEIRRQSREAGFDRHIVKPLEPATLALVLEEVRRRKGAMAESE